MLRLWLLHALHDSTRLRSIASLIAAVAVETVGALLAFKPVFLRMPCASVSNLYLFFVVAARTKADEVSRVIGPTGSACDDVMDRKERPRMSQHTLRTVAALVALNVRFCGLRRAPIHATAYHNLAQVAKP